MSAYLLDTNIWLRVDHLLTFNRDDFRQFNEITTVDPAQIVAPQA